MMWEDIDTSDDENDEDYIPCPEELLEDSFQNELELENDSVEESFQETALSDSGNVSDHSTAEIPCLKELAENVGKQNKNLRDQKKYFDSLV